MLSQNPLWNCCSPLWFKDLVMRGKILIRELLLCVWFFFDVQNMLFSYYWACCIIGNCCLIWRLNKVELEIQRILSGPTYTTCFYLRHRQSIFWFFCMLTQKIHFWSEEFYTTFCWSVKDCGIFFKLRWDFLRILSLPAYRCKCFDVSKRTL